MPNLTSIGLTGGAGSSGTGTISTLDNVIGTAGTASPQVLSVQGIASGTALVTSSNIQLAGTAVTGGAGATAAGTPRITLASDSPGIIATGTAGAPSSTVLTVQGATSMSPVFVSGDIASGTTDSGNPAKIGGLAKTANPSAVADGQRVSQLYDKLGKAITVGAIRVLKGTQKTTISASTSEITIVTAVAATFLDLYGLVLSNTGSTTTKVDIRDTTGGSIIATIEVPATDTRGFMLPVDSAIGQTTVNTNWTAQCAASTTAMEVTALFVKNL